MKKQQKFLIRNYTPIHLNPHDSGRQGLMG